MKHKRQPHKQFGFHLRLDQANIIEELAYQRDVTISQIMRELVDDYLLKQDNDHLSKN
jgi:hypothetical protein